MGNSNSDNSMVLLVFGLEKSGKSLFIKKLLELKKKEKELVPLEPTLGFNYVTLDYLGSNYHIWEVGGDVISRSYWQTFYRNLNVNVVIYIININDTDNHHLALKEFLILVNEEELKMSKFIIIFNLKIDSKIKRLNFTDQDKQEVKTRVEELIIQLKESPIHDYDNRVNYFIFDISKIKEGEHITTEMLNKCFLIKEKDINNEANT